MKGFHLWSVTSVTTRWNTERITQDHPKPAQMVSEHPSAPTNTYAFTLWVLFRHAFDTHQEYGNFCHQRRTHQESLGWRQLTLCWRTHWPRMTTTLFLQGQHKG